MIDFKTELGRAAKKLLDSEYVIWLTTVDRDLIPQPRPVWFIWDADAVLVFSKPDTGKIRHIRHHANVSLHFNSDSRAEEHVLVFTGIATLPLAAPHATAVDAYIKKYKKGMTELDLTPESFSQSYSQTIRVALNKVRGWA